MEAIKDLITCGVCLEIYTDPQLLPCLHTLCHSCIKLLVKHGEVLCPECRDVCDLRAVKKNFHTQSLVDIYKQNIRPVSSISRKRSSQGCQICGKGTIKGMCVDCDKMICGGCRVNHASIPSCSKHVVEDIKDVCANSKAKLNGLQKRLGSLKKTCQGKMKDVECYSEKLKSMRKECDDTLLASEQQAIQKIKETFDTFRSKIKTTISAEEKKVAKLDRRTKFVGSEIEEMLELVQEVSALGNDAVRLITATDELCEGAEEQFKDLTVENMIVGDMKVDINVKPLPDLNELVKYDIQHVRETCDKQYQGVLMSSLLDCTLEETFHFQTNAGPVLQICSSENGIITLHEDMVQLFGMDGMPQKSWKHKQLKHARAMVPAPCSTDLIIATGDHGEGQLLQFKSDGTLVESLSDNEVADIAASGKRLFALAVKQKKILLYTLNQDNKLEESENISLDVSKVNSLDTILATNISVLVCNYKEGRILEYTHNGKLMHDITYGKNGSEKRMLLTCSADEAGAALCIDQRKGKLVVLDAHRKWHPVALAKDIKGRIYAVFDCNGKLWVSNGSDILCFGASK